jgi:hypothetical protein
MSLRPARGLPAASHKGGPYKGRPVRGHPPQNARWQHGGQRARRRSGSKREINPQPRDATSPVYAPWYSGGAAPRSPQQRIWFR